MTEEWYFWSQKKTNATCIDVKIIIDGDISSILKSILTWALGKLSQWLSRAISIWKVENNKLIVSIAMGQQDLVVSEAVLRGEPLWPIWCPS